MPLPKPNDKEKKSDFISRCMSSDIVKKDFDDSKQMLAVCYSQFEDAKKESKASAEFGGEEIIVTESNYNYKKEENKAVDYDHEMTIPEAKMKELHDKGETYITQTDGDQKMIIKVKYSKQ